MRLVLLRIIVVSGLSAIAMAASGCLGDSDAEAESPPATTTEQVETQPPAKSAADMSKFRAAFKEAYGDRPWYGLITGMEVADGSGRPHIKVTTELGPENNGTETVRTICLAAINFAFESGAVDEIPEGAVTGSDGVGLGACA